MKRYYLLAALGVTLIVPGTLTLMVHSQSTIGTPTRLDRFRPAGGLANEQAALHGTRPNAVEAPTGYDNLSNGYLEQGPPFETLNEGNVVALRSFNDDRFIFEQTEKAADGVGPTYNAQSCRECHENPLSGGSSQVTELRTGRLIHKLYYESQGGTIIQSRATYPEIVEYVNYPDDNLRSLRISPSLLGLGFVECIANQTLLALRDQQPVSMRGLAIEVPVLEANSLSRIGRFGWKSQHASLFSFSTDAYLNEMGITTPLLPEENESNGRYVGYGSGYDPLPDPEDDGQDVGAFTDFIRATKAPARGPITPEVQAGEQLFQQIGCAICHTPSLTTAPPGTVINGGKFTIPEALGNKTIHPYSDFLLHDVGTGDGIPIQPIPEFAATAEKFRTAPLWGLRTRNRLMHDGLSLTPQEAILRHAGQAAKAKTRFKTMHEAEQQLLLGFLRSL